MVKYGERRRDEVRRERVEKGSCGGGEEKEESWRLGGVKAAGGGREVKGTEISVDKQLFFSQKRKHFTENKTFFHWYWKK